MISYVKMSPASIFLMPPIRGCTRFRGCISEEGKVPRYVMLYRISMANRPMLLVLVVNGYM